MHPGIKNAVKSLQGAYRVSVQSHRIDKNVPLLPVIAQDVQCFLVATTRAYGKVTSKHGAFLFLKVTIIYRTEICHCNLKNPSSVL
jgi:hypothetical protein